MKKQISKKQYKHRNKKYKNSKRYKHTKGGQPEDDGDTIVASIANSPPDDDEETRQIPSYLEKPSTISTNKESTITAITELDNDITRFQPTPHEFTLTHPDSRYPFNFDVHFFPEKLDEHIQDIITSFSNIREQFPQGFNLDSFHLTVQDILAIIRRPMFITVVKERHNLYNIIVTDGKKEIIEISVDEFQKLENKEGVFLLSILKNIFHALHREKGSINITLNKVKQIGNDNRELEEILDTYFSFFELIIARFYKSLSVKQFIYILSLFTLDDIKSTSFLISFTRSMTEKLQDIGIIIPTGSNIVSGDGFDTSEIIYKYGIELNNILQLPDPKYEKTLSDLSKDVSNTFVSIVNKQDSKGVPITEIEITKFTVTFITLTLNTGSKIRGSKILIAITLNKEVSNLTRNTYDYSLKYIWTINTNIQQKLMRYYSINNYIPYFDKITVLHSGIKRVLKGSPLEFLTRGEGPYRYFTKKTGGNNKKKITKRKRNIKL